MAALSVTGSSSTIHGTCPNEDRAENLSSVSLGPVIAIVMVFVTEAWQPADASCADLMV